MYALILAGGKGERLRPLTDSVPKPMVPVRDKPILLHQIEWLKQVGVTDVVFLVGYRWQTIQDYFKDGSEFGVRAHYSVEDSPLGRGGAIRQGFSQIPEEEDTVLVLNGDIITAERPSAVLDCYRQKKAADPSQMAAIMVVPMVSPYGLVDTSDQDDVVGFREKVELPYWINAGIYVFDRRIAPQLPELGDHETSTFPQLAQAGKISAFKSRAFWRSVDSFKDLREAEEYLSS
jgi:NDP-sugar pyrophosphorylase family protein